MDTQVIVVGAGPVGLMLAAELRLGGAQVVVLERLEEPTTESRASTLHARTMEIFDQRGLLEQVGTPPSQRMGHFGGIPLDLGALPSRFPGQWKLAQTQVEQLLAQWATGLGADIRRGHEVLGLTLSSGGVQVDAAGPDGPVRVTGSYLVGCDGEESTVRRLAGIAMRGTEATHDLFRADVAGIDVVDRRFERLPNGLAIAGRLLSGVTRVMVSESGRSAGRSTQATFEDVCKAWQRVTGEDISHGTPLWVNAFDNASRLAERYRDGRILLAGDAAHQQMPSGGQAINLGLQDAVNLGWKLAAEVSGGVSDGLLDSYASERHEVGRHVLRNIEAQSLLLLGDADIEPARTVLAELISYPVVRDLLAGMISGLDVRYETGEHSLVGARMPDVQLETAHGSCGSATLLRSGAGVLLDLSADAARAAWLRETVANCARAVNLVPATQQAADGPLDGVDTVLIRPDGYVAWIGSRTQDPTDALCRWFGLSRRAVGSP
jgi:2-polyprenyl-6-methoxyphenol hydroxylase-like FAD-dependent oxidoreductase